MRYRTGFMLGALLALHVLGGAHSLSIVLHGSFLDRTIGASDLIAGAGSDLNGAYESGDDVDLHVSGATGPDDFWRIEVHMEEVVWSGSLHLWIRRTSDGVGDGSLSGGTVYQELSGSPQSFIEGTGNVDDVMLRIKLTGVSIQLPPASYGAMIYLTVVDI
jgi:hypothetical protein